MPRFLVVFIGKDKIVSDKITAFFKKEKGWKRVAGYPFPS